MFCCVVLENLIATSSVNVCMMIAIRQTTTFNTGEFPNPYIVIALCTVVLALQVAKNGGVGPMRETMAKGSELPGHEESAGVGIAQAQGAALHNQRARRCTGYVIPTKPRVLLRLSVAR